jgi:vacuolar protein sorting-associated protein 54
MNQVSSQNITVAAFNAIRSSIPINLKPPPLSSFVKLPYGKQHTVLAPSNKRSAPSPIKLSRSPTIPLSDFDSYLEQVQVHYDRWQQNLTTNSKVIKSLRPNHSTDLLVSPTNQSDHSSTQALHPSPSLPSLSSVPHVFFDQKFSLNDPLTFDLLTQQPSQSSPITSPTKSELLDSTHLKPSSSSTSSNTDLTTDHILLDKLSHYLDLVELHLVQEISLRSSDFFSALGNLQALHAQTSSSVAQIEALKNQLDQLKQTVSDKALKIIRYGIRRRNINSIELALTKLNDVWQTVHGIEELIQSGEWQSALGLIQDLEKLWHSTTVLSSTSSHQSTDSNQSSVPSPAPPIKLRLSKLKALAALPKRLSVFRSTISKALVAELSSILSHDLKINLAEFASSHSLDQPQSIDLKSPMSSPLSSSHQNGSQARDRLKSLSQERLKERVRSTFDGLIRAGGMDNALGAWKEGVIKQIREIVKNALSDVIEGDLDDKDDSSDISQFNSKEKRNALSDKTYVFRSLPFWLGLICSTSVANTPQNLW